MNSQYQIDILQGDQKEAYNTMIRLSYELIDKKNPLKIANELEKLILKFQEGSIQYNVLIVLQSFIFKLIDMTGKTEIEIDLMYANVAGDIEIASKFFRFTIPEGAILPSYFPSDDEYVKTVSDLFENDSGLHKISLLLEQMHIA